MGGGEVFLIRHAEADYDTIAGHGPVFVGARRDFAPLTTVGRRQAQLVADELRAYDIGLVVSSPYTRALQTAAVIVAELGCELAVDPRLHDWLPVRDARMPISGDVVADKIREYQHAAETGMIPPTRTWESANDMRARLHAVVADLQGTSSVAIVGHEAPIQSVIGAVPVPVGSIHRLTVADIVADPTP